MAEKFPLVIELECVDLPTQFPPGVNELRLGVQVGPMVEQDALCPAEQVILRVPVQVAIDPGEGALHFSGKAVHGPSSGKFLYLCWGEWGDDGEWRGNRRAKLPLGPVTREMVETALRSGQPLRARIHMTDARGQPVAASLKPGIYEWGI